MKSCYLLTTLVIFGCATPVIPEGHWGFLDHKTRFEIKIQPSGQCWLYTGGKLDGLVAKCQLEKASSDSFNISIIGANRNVNGEDGSLILKHFNNGYLSLIFRNEEITLHPLDKHHKTQALKRL